jgi:hypothetical protein
MPAKRFQITIRDLLLATFWFGVTIAAWGWAYRLGGQPVGTVADPLKVFGTLALGWSAMFPAIWSLFGRARTGFIIGTGMWALLLVAGSFVMV